MTGNLIEREREGEEQDAEAGREREREPTGVEFQGRAVGYEQCLLYYCIECRRGQKAGQEGGRAGVFKESQGANGIDVMSVK